MAGQKRNLRKVGMSLRAPEIGRKWTIAGLADALSAAPEIAESLPQEPERLRERLPNLPSMSSSNRRKEPDEIPRTTPPEAPSQEARRLEEPNRSRRTSWRCSGRLRSTVDEKQLHLQLETGLAISDTSNDNWASN